MGDLSKKMDIFWLIEYRIIDKVLTAKDSRELLLKITSNLKIIDQSIYLYLHLQTSIITLNLIYILINFRNYIVFKFTNEQYTNQIYSSYLL